MQTLFRNHLALADLPYFVIKQGSRLALADPGLGPAVDIHNHLALAYLRPMSVDLHAAPRATQHYLSMERPLDLSVYQNRNFTPQDLSRMSRDLTWSSTGRSGMRSTHTIPNLLAEMADLGVRYSVLLPIDFPFLSDNAGTYLQATRGQQGLVCFGSVHPYARDVEGKLDRQVALGARGIKVHPAVQLVRPDRPRPMRLYRLCGQRRLPVMFHCGPVGIEPRLGRYMSQVRHYRKAVEECPDTIFILGHSGALQLDEALDLACRNENVYLDLASQSIGGVQKILRTGPTDRVLNGSDWPFYHQASALAKVLLLTDGDAALRRRVLYDNAARLLGLPPA